MSPQSTVAIRQRHIFFRSTSPRNHKAGSQFARRFLYVGEGGGVAGDPNCFRETFLVLARCCD